MTMWSAYEDTSRWTEWAPHIRGVEPAGPLEDGMRGVVAGPLGTSARFEVTCIDRAEQRWTWKVQVGPARLTIAHEGADGVAAIEIDGPAPPVIAYTPLARRALNRLVRLA